MLDVLSEIEILRPIPREGLARLALLGRRRVFEAGAVLMHQGDPSKAMYIITRGLVRVVREHQALAEPLHLADLGDGEIVGEMGVLDGEPRSATVTALEETETIEIGSTSLSLTILQFPEVAGVLLKTFSQRLRSTDELAEQLLHRAQGSFAS